MSPFVNDPDFVLHVGDALDVLGTLPDESVHCVVTSPPYWGLRDYGAEGQLGLEPTPEEYVANMVNVFREVRRVLRRDGTCWLNIGDSYGSGTTADRGPTSTQGPDVPASWSNRSQAPRNGLKPKDLVGIPWRLAFALQADGWYLRSDIIWSKPNPMPESVTERPTKAHEYLFLLTRSPRYFYDADAIREPAEYGYRNHSEGWRSGVQNGDGHRSGGGSVTGGNPASGRNKRSVWEIATEPYPDAHFATFPQALVEPCVLAGTSERGCCPVCGAPWERETDVSYEKSPVHGAGSVVGRHYETGANNYDGAGMPRLNKVVETTGWRPTCQCREAHEVFLTGDLGPPVPCTVLDPFMGSGTVAVVARRLGRRAVGIELNPEYALLASKRLAQLSLLAA